VFGGTHNPLVAGSNKYWNSKGEPVDTEEEANKE